MYNCCILKKFLLDCHHQLPTHPRKHCFCFPSFCILSSCARQTFWLIGRRLQNFFRSKGMYYSCIMKILLPDCHYHPGNSPENIFSFPSFCILSSCTRQTLWLIVRMLRTFLSDAYKGMYHCFILKIFLLDCHHPPGNSPQKTFLFFSLFLYSFILCQANS